MTIRIFILLVLALLYNADLFAQEEIKEEELFSEPGAIVETGKVKETDIAEEEKKTFGVSGEAIGAVEYTGSRDWVEGGGDDANFLHSSIIGKFYLDARLKRGTKYFGNVEVQNGSLSDGTDFAFRESFIDFNVKRAVYFRGGKQVLQWGRCYLWNPSDLINVEKRTFIKKLSSREGTFGVKAHAPFGTDYNAYGFWDMHGASDLEDTAVAGKFEFLAGKTEMAFSLWRKEGARTVYAYDVSTRLLGIDALGEIAVSDGDNFEKLKEENGVLTTFREDGWTPRASLDFGRAFDFREVIDRITVNLELFYNHGGYDENVFNDNNIYAFSEPVFFGNVPLSSGTKGDFLRAKNLYEPNYHSRYYAAIFANYKKFILSDMTLSVNLIENLDDKSAILTSGISYTDINDFTAGFDLFSYWGDSGGEYTFSNNAFTSRFTIGVLF